MSPHRSLAGFSPKRLVAHTAWVLSACSLFACSECTVLVECGHALRSVPTTHRVRIHFCVDGAGDKHEVLVVESSGLTSLDELALAHVRAAPVEPLIVDDRPVTACTTWEIRAPDDPTPSALRIHQSPLEARVEAPSTPTSEDQSARCVTATTGALCTDDVMTALENCQADLRFCYLQALEEQPATMGRITVRVDFNPDGSPGRIALTQNDTGDTLLGDCVANTIQRRLMVPAIHESTTVVVPLDFFPKSGDLDP